MPRSALNCEDDRRVFFSLVRVILDAVKVKLSSRSRSPPGCLYLVFESSHESCKSDSRLLELGGRHFLTWRRKQESTVLSSIDKENKGALNFSNPTTNKKPMVLPLHANAPFPIPLANAIDSQYNVVALFPTDREQ